MKRIKSIQSMAWRRLITNYVGGIGYYALLFAVLLWCLGIYQRLASYIVFESHLPTQFESSVTAGSSSSAVSMGALMVTYLFTAFMIIVTLVIIVAVPYVIGKYSSKVLRQLFTMTNQRMTLANLFIYKMSCCVAMIAITLITQYNYTQDVTDNWFGVVLIAISVFASLFFWLQHLLARVWKIAFKNVF